MNVRIEESWRKALAMEFDKPYFESLVDFVKDEYRQKEIYPSGARIFAAFDAVGLDSVKVVILGQDPYPGVGQANGLAFSVNKGVPVPRSLVNIFKEIEVEYGTVYAQDGDLSRWAKQGVLLLNSTLTVERGVPTSHQGKGWEEFTDAVIRTLNEKRDGLVYMLWGNYAIKKGQLIDRNRHLVLTSVHPSPLSASRGFFGNNHFRLANEYLIKAGQKPIDWR